MNFFKKLQLFIKKYWLFFILLIVGATYIFINLANKLIQWFSKVADVNVSPLHISANIQQMKNFGIVYKLLNLIPMLALYFAFAILLIMKKTTMKFDKKHKYITIANVLPGITAMIPEPLIAENLALIFIAVIIYIIVI